MTKTDSLLLAIQQTLLDIKLALVPAVAREEAGPDPGLRPSNTGAGTANNITVGVAATLLAENNQERLSLVVTNDSASDLLVFFADAVFPSTVPFTVLTAGGGTMICGPATDIPYTGRVFGTVAVGTAVIRIGEISKIFN